MPIYEFICNKCEIEFEELIHYSEINSIRCPNCGNNPERKISKSTCIFKGTGWSNTGYCKIDDHKDNEEGGCVRIPHYKDRNSGAIGLGKPEVANIGD